MYTYLYISISQSPVEQLQDVSLASGWGEPVYTPVPEPESPVSPAQGAGDTSGPAAGAKFCYKVTIVMMVMMIVNNFVDDEDRDRDDCLLATVADKDTI